MISLFKSSPDLYSMAKIFSVIYNVYMTYAWWIQARGYLTTELSHYNEIPVFYISVLYFC